VKAIMLEVRGIENYSEKQWRIMLGTGSVYINKAEMGELPALGEKLVLMQGTLAAIGEQRLLDVIVDCRSAVDRVLG
jgi:hypothetical protein